MFKVHFDPHKTFWALALSLFLLITLLRSHLVRERELPTGATNLIKTEHLSKREERVATSEEVPQVREQAQEEAASLEPEKLGNEADPIQGLDYLAYKMLALMFAWILAQWAAISYLPEDEKYFPFGGDGYSFPSFMAVSLASDHLSVFWGSMLFFFLPAFLHEVLYHLISYVQSRAREDGSRLRNPVNRELITMGILFSCLLAVALLGTLRGWKFDFTFNQQLPRLLQDGDNPSKLYFAWIPCFFMIPCICYKFLDSVTYYYVRILTFDAQKKNLLP